MEKVEGPWAMVYFCLREGMVWFGRDCLGRRSLLRRVVVGGVGVEFCSVGVDMVGWEEVRVDGLWSLDLNEWSERSCGGKVIEKSIKLYPWGVEGSTVVGDDCYMVCPRFQFSLVIRYEDIRR
jgi:hypothetical protein